MDPWYKIATLRREVREGRSFNPDEFAIALEQVVAKTAPEDYRDPAQFFARTCFTRALRDHAGMEFQNIGSSPICVGRESNISEGVLGRRAGGLGARYRGKTIRSGASRCLVQFLSSLAMGGYGRLRCPPSRQGLLLFAGSSCSFQTR